MGQPSRYWIYIGLESSGQLRKIPIPSAETFFRQELDDLADQSNVSDRGVQRHLSFWLHSENADARKHAELCLRCFTSHALQACCTWFANSYGKHYAFDVEDVWPLALRNAYELKRAFIDLNDNSSWFLETQILKKFDPTKSGLSTWVRKCFKSAPEIKRFSEEKGFEQISDWLILKQTSVKRLSKILSEYFSQTPIEINPQVELLEAFHTVYCTDIAQRSSSKAPYPIPSSIQLEQIRRLLSSCSGLNSHEILWQLTELAQQLRRCRNKSSSNIMPSLSLDQFPNASDIQASRIEPLVPFSSSEREQEIAHIIENYCNAYLSPVVTRVIDHRIELYSRKRNGEKKVKTLLQALELFYCHSLPQKEIAATLGLANQTAVSRLLDLPNLYADMSRHLLDCLTQKISELAHARRDPEQLRSAAQQISHYLHPHVEELVHQAKQEGFTNRNREMRCPLSQTIRDYLHTRKQ